ncbi:flagellar brake protein [Vibrio aquaticus]|uniref:Flagellar brake protein n=1 Tax=Vibrio aquaticus TaxID=2496559 RepID=A0A432D234_9VIBR|nr:flagellar brake protein [Vibrio aquaticus]RTZ17982.1 flagellar brake protein [Vibrio aquaticus]
MNTQAVARKAQPVQTSNDRNISTLNSTDALAMIEHGGELTIGISTPVGTTFRCKTSFIGTHSDSFVLAELPKISEDDLNFFFQEGFWATIRAISPRGEGAIVHFRSQLQHIFKAPIPIVALSIPQTMQVSQLRKEPRFDVNLAARVVAESHKLDCEIRDLSKSGCRFITAPLSRSFQVGEEISLHVQLNTKGPQFEPLFGKVCNLQRSLHYARYGIQFTGHGKSNAKTLLGHLKFNGTKLTLK